MTMSPEPRTGIDMLERILAASGALVSLQTRDSGALLAKLGAHARHSGQSIYIWRPQTGLANLREVDVPMPGSQRFGNALRYIQQSHHFGVYLMMDLPLPLVASDAVLLRQLAREPAGHVRRIVLLDAATELLDGLGGDLVRLGAPEPAILRPRLRDGRWVV